MSRDHVKSQTLIKTLFAHLNLYSKTPELETLRLRVTALSPAQASDAFKPVSMASQHEPNALEPQLGEAVIQQAPASCLKTLESMRQKDSGTAFFERRPRIFQDRPALEQPSNSELKRRALIQQALRSYPNLLTHDRVLLTHQDPGSTSSTNPHHCIHLLRGQLLATHIKNWPGNDLVRNVNGLIVGMILWLANLCYGGFHAAAWNEHFSSTAEKHLWRFSAAYIASCGGF